MKKVLSIIILLITSLLILSCNHNKSGSSSTAPLGKIGEITVDPNGVTPLSAIYRTESVNTASITVTVKGLYGEPDIIHTYPAGYGTEFEIHGMFPESDNVIEVNDGGRIITENVPIGSLSYNTTSIPSKYDVVNDLPEEEYKNNPELYFCINATYPYNIAVSKNGYVRYLQNNYLTSKLVIENKKMVFYPTFTAQHKDLLGKLLVKYPKGAHHDTIKVNDEYIYVAYSTWGYEDRLNIINDSGTLLEEYSFGKLIQNAVDFTKYPEDEAVFKQVVFGEDVNNIYAENGVNKYMDWFHGNSLVYDSSKDILYVSARNRGVLAIDFSEWKLIWWMADETLYSRDIKYDVHFRHLKSLEPYKVKGDGMNDGPKNQHALFLLQNGNLGMFDNQGDEWSNPNGSRYVEYEITGEHGNYTAKKVYEYRDPSLYSINMSDVDFTGKNYENLLLIYSSPQARILEIEKNTKKVLFRLDLPFTMYRVDKMPLYYDEGRVYSEDCNLKNPN